MIKYSVLIAVSVICENSTLANTRYVRAPSNANFTEQRLDFRTHRETILQNLKNVSESRLRIVGDLIDEMEAFGRGERTRASYGASRFGIGPIFEWWCSEFAQSILLRSGLFDHAPQIKDEISKVNLARELVEVYAKRKAGAFTQMIADDFKPGDYLATSKPGKNKANHAAITVLVDPARRFLWTIEANNHADDSITLNEREYLRPGVGEDGEFLYFVNPTFWFRGDTEALTEFEN